MLITDIISREEGNKGRIRGNRGSRGNKGRIRGNNGKKIYFKITLHIDL